MTKNGKSAKDAWDKAQIVASLLTPIVTVILGGVLGYWFNEVQARKERSEAERQLAVARADTVTNLLPQLSSSDPAVRRAALETVAALGDEQLAIRLSTVFAGPGAIAPVERLSQVPSLRESALEALGRLFESAQPSIGIIQSSHAPNQRIGTAVAVRDGLFVTSGAVVSSSPYLLFIPATGQELPAELVFQDELRGLAAFRVAEGIAPKLAIARERAENEDLLTAVGYSHGGLWRAVAGRVSTGGVQAHMSVPFGRWPPDDPETVLAGLLFLPGLLEVKLPQGFEGAPLLNDTGAITGLISSVAKPGLGEEPEPLESQDRVRYVPVEEIRKFLALDVVDPDA